MADAAVLDGRPKVLLRRVKVISAIFAALALFSFFTGPSIVNIGWLILSILTFRSTHERRASPKTLKVFSFCAGLSAVCALVAAIVVASLGGMLISCACSDTCTSDTWAVVLANQAHLNNVTSHLPPPETSSSTDADATVSASVSAPFSPSPTVVPAPAAPASRRAALPSAFSRRARFATDADADRPLVFHPRAFPSSSSRVYLFRGRGDSAWHGLRVTRSSAPSPSLFDERAPPPPPFSDKAGSEDPFGFLPPPPPPDVLDATLDALLDSARAWLSSASAPRSSASDEEAYTPSPPPLLPSPVTPGAFPPADHPLQDGPLPAQLPAPLPMRMPMPMSLFPHHGPRPGGRIRMRSLLGHDDREREWHDKYGRDKGADGGKHPPPPQKGEEEDDDERDVDFEEEGERPASVGSSLLLDFAGGHRREVTERQFKSAADGVCEGGGAGVAGVVLLLFAAASFAALASASASRLAKHPWYVEAAAIRRAARWGGGDGAFPPAIAAAAASGVPLPVAIAAASQAPGPAQPDERVLYRFVAGRGFVPVTQAPAAPAPPPPAVPGDARPLRQELAAVLSSASAALASMLRPGGARGYEAVPTAVEMAPPPPAPAGQPMQVMIRGQEPGGLSAPPAAPPPPPPGSAQSYASVYAPSPYAPAPQQQWGGAPPASPYSYGGVQ